jgi:hypothetical protein
MKSLLNALLVETLNLYVQSKRGRTAATLQAGLGALHDSYLRNAAFMFEP